MHRLKESIPNHSAIRNIIFDFGGVICDLDIPRTQEKFKAFGPSRPEFITTPEISAKRFEELVEAFEKGLVSAGNFRKTIRDHYITPPDDASINDTWNALLVGIPPQRVRLLESIRKRYRIFLLSNSNEIHYHHYLNDFRVHFGYDNFYDLFEKSWFSYMLKMAKPSREIFEYVLQDGKLNPAETLFIDDTLKHVEAASTLGIVGYHLKIKEGETILDLFLDTE